ncbi:MAG: MMPL family transporter [Alphaproteobacteria bacterium]|nr:MMPL family transporter [Alphaproteobacteria bacterium]
MLRERFFDLLARLAARHALAVLLVSCALTALSVAVASGIEIRTNFKDLLGPGDPVSERMGRLEEQFVAASSVRLLLEGNDPERLVAAGQALTERLEAKPEKVRQVWFELPVDFFMEHGLLFLQPDDLRLLASGVREREPQVRRLLADPSTLGLLGLLDEMMQDLARPASSVATVNARMFGELDLAQQRGNAADVGLSLRTAPLADQLHREMVATVRPLPLPGSKEEALSGLQAMNALLTLVADVLDQGERLSEEEFAARARALRDLSGARLGMPTSRYVLSEAGDALLIDVAANEAILNNDVAGPFINWLEGEMDAVRVAYPDVEVSVTGLPVLLKQESDALLDNFILVSLLGFLGIIAVFIIGFERVGLPSLSAVPLVMGTCWTFGIITAARGGLTLFSLTFPVLLFGIGVDFAIHLLAGYAEQRRTVDDPEQALRQAFDKVGAGLLTGALTTAMAFLVLTTAAFYGLQDMGFTAGVGVLTALIAMLTVLPAIVVLYDRRQQARGELLPDVPFPFLEPLGELLVRQRYPVMAAFLVVSLVFAYYAPTVGMDENYVHQLPEGLPAVVAQEQVMERFGVSNEMVAFIADDLDEVDRISAAAERSPSVSEVVSVAQYIPDRQAEKAEHIAVLRELLQEMAPEAQEPPPSWDAEDIEALRDHLASVKVSALQLSALAATLYDAEVQDEVGALRDLINRIGARADLASAERLRRLDSLLAGEITDNYALLVRATQHETLTPEDLPPALLNLLRGADGSWVVMVRGSGDVWDSAFRHQLLDDLRRIDPENVGMISAWDRGLGMLLSELPRMFLWTSVVVFLLVLFDVRSLRAAALTCTPLALGLVWTVGILGVLGLPFTMLSVISIPLLVGIGIDSGVHVYHRIHQEHSISRGLMLSGKPVLLTSMTTTIGFGSLLLSVHPGFRGLGLATAIGILSCLLISLLLLPAMVAIFDEGIEREEEP